MSLSAASGFVVPDLSEPVGAQGLARLARRVSLATTPDGWIDAAIRLVLVREASDR